MGSYERDWVEDAEKSVNAAINGYSVDDYTNKVGLSIVEYIEKEFNTTVTHSEWTGGGDYNNFGDLETYTTSIPIIPVELKFSKAKNSGTKMNPTTNILKKFLNFPIMNYPDFDKKLGLKDKRYRLVENRIGRDLKNVAEYKRILKKIRDIDGDKDFIDKIVEITKPGKIKYATYVAEKLNDELDATQNLVDFIFSKSNLDKLEVEPTVGKLIYCVIKKFETDKQYIEYHNFSEMDSNVTSVVASGQSIKIQNKYGKDILRFSVNWKNICQGGATPCFCVFVGNAFKN